jgi:peptide/nickel transport system substrate-binding protein
VLLTVRSFRPIVHGLLLFATLPFLAGCEKEGHNADAAHRRSVTPDSTARRGGRLVIGVQREPERLVEILSATATTHLVGNLIHGKFVKYDDELRLVPDIIETIPTVENGGISKDHLTYTYRLREGVRWHDGRPVTSADVKFTYEIIMDPKVNVESREGWDRIEAVETPDDRTVVFRLARPYPDFVGETFYDEAVLPKHLLEGERGDDFHLSAYHNAPVGCGPFIFKDWVRGSHLVVERNDDYFGEGPYLDEVVFKFVPDENTLLVQLKTGEIDVYDNANVSFLEQIHNMSGVAVYHTPSLMYEHLDLNLENPILADKRVRQALGFATNKRDIAEKVYRGLAEIAALDEHPSSRYFSSSAASGARFDQKEARRLLQDAGWVDTDGDGIRDKGGRPLVLTVSATSGNPDRERTEVVLRDQYRQVGVDLRIKNYSPSVLYGSYDDHGILKRGRFDIAMYAWLSSPEPATKQSLYGKENIPPSGQNHPRIRHDELTQLLDRGANELDPERRVEIYYQVADILVDEVPVIPLFWYTSVDVGTKRLHNFRPNPTQSADTWNANTWYVAD